MRTANLGSIDQAVYAESLSRLQEAAEYLKRLPSVPATLQLARDIEKFLNDPETLVQQRMALEKEEEMRLRRLSREASTFTPAGVPVVQVQVVGETLKMRISDGYLDSPSEAPQRRRLVDLAMRQLQEGLVLELVTTESDPPADALP